MKHPRKVRKKNLSCAALLSLVPAIFWAAVGGAGCGYTLQTSENKLLKEEEVRTVFIPPVTNNTFKPGVENIVYNQMVRTILAHGNLKVVSNPEEADAILQGMVTDAGYGGTRSQLVSALTPNGVGANLPHANYSVSTEYNATLGCVFTLSRRRPAPKKRGVIWSGGAGASRLFFGANQLDVPGTTSPLIVESEFERALQDMAHNMMDDMHDNMLAVF